MYELWHCYSHWSEEQEQAEADKRAIRIMTCRRRACRRMRDCKAASPSKQDCPGLVANPMTEGERQLDKALLYFMLKRSVAEDDCDEETRKALAEWREANAERRRKLAWERAKVVVRS
jgi:hypothetical protein